MSSDMEPLINVTAHNSEIGLIDHLAAASEITRKSKVYMVIQGLITVVPIAFVIIIWFTLEPRIKKQDTLIQELQRKHDDLLIKIDKSSSDIEILRNNIIEKENELNRLSTELNKHELLVDNLNKDVTHLEDVITNQTIQITNLNNDLYTQRGLVSELTRNIENTSITVNLLMADITRSESIIKNLTISLTQTEYRFIAFESEFNRKIQEPEQRLQMYVNITRENVAESQVLYNNTLIVYENTILETTNISNNMDKHLINFVYHMDNITYMAGLLLNETTTAIETWIIESNISSLITKKDLRWNDTFYVTKDGEVRIKGNMTIGTYITRLDINSIMNLGNQPIISGQIGTAMINPKGPQKLDFNHFWVSRGISYNSTTRRFTISVAGVYRITLNPFFERNSGDTRVVIGVNTDDLNWGNHKGQTYSNVDTYNTGNLNSVVNLEIDDFIVFYLLSGSLHNDVGKLFNQFSIEKLA